jgi:CO dehydrogenase nickel-insertion accessory protein CooC1
MKSALEERGYEVVEVDVDKDPELKRKYGLNVPVAVQGGRLLAKHRLE